MIGSGIFIFFPRTDGLFQLAQKEFFTDVSKNTRFENGMV